jgi:hypothetical protein
MIKEKYVVFLFLSGVMLNVMVPASLPDGAAH